MRHVRRRRGGRNIRGRHPASPTPPDGPEKITFMARLRASSCSDPRFDLKIHLLKSGKPACGQTVTSKSTNAIEDVSCKKCLAMIRVMRHW